MREIFLKNGTILAKNKEFSSQKKEEGAADTLPDMAQILPNSLLALAAATPKPLYLVGGAVRNFLASLPPSEDYDICGAMTVEEVSSAAEACGMHVVAVYPRTNTARIKDGNRIYEFTAFRTERYDKGGAHTPVSVAFTKSVKEDAERRDFSCNAVYYNLTGGGYEDPLFGISDIKRGIIRAYSGEKVFQSDGLRLLRLARFAGELCFTVEEETLCFAQKYAANIDDISTERVVEELKKILLCDTKYPQSGENAPVRALQVLQKIGVLPRLFPFTALADGLAQRADFHAYDVWNHTLRAVQYIPADLTLRLAAFLHDAGKPYAVLRDGTMHGHEQMSADLAQEYLTKYNFGNKIKEDVVHLCRHHMFDLNGKARPITRRRFLLKNAAHLSGLFALMQADFSACKDDRSKAPLVTRLTEEYARMQSEGVPFSLADLQISAQTLVSMGFSGKEIGETLSLLWEECVQTPRLNTEAWLTKRAERHLKMLRRKK